MLTDNNEYKTKMNKLMIEFNAGRLADTDFINSFMPRVWNKIKTDRELTDREKEVIDDLFERN